MDSRNLFSRYVIPPLDDIISPDSDSTSGPYSRDSFISFLSSSHCMENLEFVSEIDKFIAHLAQADNDIFVTDEAIVDNIKLHRQWTYIYNVFLHHDSVKEVNIPGKDTADLRPEILPRLEQVVAVRKLAFELLSTNYNDFVSYKREAERERANPRRCSETVAPEALCPNVSNVSFASPHSCFRHDHLILSPQWDKTLFYSQTIKSDDSSSTETGSGMPSRNGSAGTLSTRASSRGSSISSIFDNLKDYSGWKKTVKILRSRRSSSEKRESISS